MRTPMIAGNWKMNTTVDEAVELAARMKESLDEIKGVEKVLCPPFVSLAPVKEVIGGSTIKLGAQNLYFEEKGAYTGEISPLMLASLCEYVIIGHSERRQYFGESGDIVNRKVKATIKAGLKPILCIGENLEERESGQTEPVLGGQLKSSLQGMDNLEGVVLAYEPIWAIGTGKAATAGQANETIGFIRNILSGIGMGEVAGNTRILYGGSVKAENADEIIGQPEIDGALVGGASLKADQFHSIVKQSAAYIA